MSLFELLGPDFRSRAEHAHRWYASEVARLVDAFPGAHVDLIALQMCHCVPWLFADAYPELSEDDLQCVAASGLLYSGHILRLDRVVDGDVNASGVDLLLGSLMHERALTLLFPRLPANTVAWDTLARYVRQYVQALGIEARHRGQIRPFPLELAERVGAGKGAVLKASPMIMACMAGRPEVIALLDAAIDPFNTAVQIRDDLEDWSADYQAENYSFVLTRALTGAGLDAVLAAGQRPAVDDVGHALFYSTVAIEALEHAIACCEAAAERATDAGFTEWRRYLGLARMHLQTLAKDVARLRERGLRVAAHAGDPGSSHDAIDGLLMGLAREHAAGYPDAQHRMSFPRSQGFAGRDDFHTSDVFQRAILGWLYHDLLAAGRQVPLAIVRENVERLAAYRLPGQRGGWSYFPTVAELPPDTDDLAQVIHAALAVRVDAVSCLPALDLERRAEESVELVLTTHVRDDGAVETWIIDPDGSASLETRYREAIRRYWGRGADPEVVANFYAALMRWAPARHAEHARNGARYVASRQRPDGAWDSTWYVGPFYGTFICARLLRLTDAEPQARRRAAEFLRNTQHRDGGWGSAAESDALSTALALLAWTECGADAPVTDALEIVDRARRYLIVAQREDGLWPASPFIVMNMNRPDEHAPPRLVTYQSATVTGAFAGAALLAATQAPVGGALATPLASA